MYLINKSISKLKIKINKPTDNIASLKILILRLQFTLEISQIQEILSTYNELLLFFAKYGFLFENDSLEIRLSKNTYISVESPLTTQDPARDGYNWYAYCSNNPLTYTDPDGMEKRSGLTWGILNILLGEDNVNRIWGDPMYDGFAKMSDTILHEAIEAPCEIISDTSSIVGIYAIATGNVPLAVGAEVTGNVTDGLKLGSKVLKAYNSGDKSDWVDAASDAASMGIGAFVSFSIKCKYVDVRVTQSAKNEGYYQKGHRGRLTNSEGFRKKLIQELAPELGKDFTTILVDTVLDDINKQINKEKGECDE